MAEYLEKDEVLENPAIASLSTTSASTQGVAKRLETKMKLLARPNGESSNPLLEVLGEWNKHLESCCLSDGMGTLSSSR